MSDQQRSPISGNPPASQPTEPEDETVMVRPRDLPQTEPEEEADDQTIAVRADALQRAHALLEDQRLKTPQGSLPNPPAARFERPNTETARGGTPDSQAERAGAGIRNMSAGSLIGVTLVTAIAVGTGLGWLVDRLLNNTGTPWGLIIGLVLGVISGFAGVFRIANQISRES